MRTKNLFKKLTFIFLTLCVTLCSCPFLTTNFSYITPALAETVQEQPDTEEENTSKLESQTNLKTILENFYIKTPTNTITLDHFSSINISGYDYSCIYLNQAVTLSTSSAFAQNDNYLINIFNKTTETDVSTSSLITIDDKKYHSLPLDVAQDQLYQINLTLKKYIPASGRVPSSVKDTSVMFYIVQTPINFKTSSTATWTYRENNSNFIISEPSNGSTYNSTFSVALPKGTILNPIYLTFEYLGQKFTIYNIKNEYFNLYDDSKLDIDSLQFEKSGFYRATIYDNTYNKELDNRSTSNYNSYSFYVKKTIDPFYILPIDQDGNIIMNQQYTNKDITLKFMNIQDIIEDVEYIEVIRSYKPTSGVNEPISTYYYPSEIEEDFNIEINKTGSYHIYIKNKWTGKNDYSLQFFVMKDITTSFQLGNDVYTLDSSYGVNTTQTHVVNQTLIKEYNGIKGSNDYNFEVYLARSQPAITGLSSKRTSDPVNLVVYGVGEIEVKITYNGKTTTETKSNRSRIATLTEQGKYLVQITDQMGNSVSTNFTITVKLNTSSIVLIGLAAGAIVGLLIFAIISRAKVKVR